MPKSYRFAVEVLRVFIGEFFATTIASIGPFTEFAPDGATSTNEPAQMAAEIATEFADPISAARRQQPQPPAHRPSTA